MVSSIPTCVPRSVNNAEKNQETSDRIRELTAAESSLCKALATGKESAEIARKTAGVWYEIVKKYKYEHAKAEDNRW